jgi:hypothetical protein
MPGRRAGDGRRRDVAIAAVTWKVASRPELAAPAANSTEPRERREREGERGCWGVVRRRAWGGKEGTADTAYDGPRDLGALSQEKFATKAWLVTCPTKDRAPNQFPGVGLSGPVACSPGD